MTTPDKATYRALSWARTEPGKPRKAQHRDADEVLAVGSAPGSVVSPGKMATPDKATYLAESNPRKRPMPDGFTDRAAWDATHWKFGEGSLLDQAVIDWQLDNQERVKAAMDAEREASE